MFIPTFIWFLAIFWSLIYAVHKRYLSSTSKYLLPGGSPAPRKSKSWSLELKNLNIKLETSVFNSFHENASVSLLARSKTRKVFGSIYDVGSVFGVLGAFGGIVVLGFTSYQTLSILLFRQNNEIASLHKRDLETTLESASAEDHDILVKALVCIILFLRSSWILILFLDSGHNCTLLAFSNSSCCTLDSSVYP